ncbi:BT4734/BF3469 family protein [Hymenobacter sp. HD11105]
MSAAVLPTPARSFGADTLACALTLTGKATPTAVELAMALAKMYPAGTAPTVPDLLAAGWLVPTVDGRSLRQPPLTSAKIDARLAGAEALGNSPDEKRNKNGIELPESRRKAEGKPDFSDFIKNAESRNKAGIDSPVAEVNSRRKAGVELPPDSREIAGKNTPSVPLFSYYRGGIAATVPYAAINPAQLHAVLISPRHRALTEALRAAPVGSPQRAELKKRLDYVTPAGTFARRANEGLASLSGLLALDFDHLPDVGAARAALLVDELLAPELVLLFTSPSGDGLKALVRTDPTAAHLDNFRAYAAYLATHYALLGLRADEAGKDVARACFVPYAPDAWLVPAYAA